MKRFFSWDKVADGAFAALLALVSTLGLAQGGAFAVLALAFGPLLAVFGGMGARRFPWPDRTILLFAGVFLIGAAFLSFFSPFPQEAWKTTLKLTSIFLPLSFFSSRVVLACAERRADVWRDRLPELLALGFVVLGAILVFTLMSYGFESKPMTKLNRGVSYGFFLLGPVLAMGSKKKKTSFFLLCAAVGVLFLTHSRTTQVAVAAGAVAGILAWVWPRGGAWGIRAGMALCLMWPLGAVGLFSWGRGVLSHLPRTLAMRVEIWDYMAHRFAERPFLGWGLGASGQLPWEEPNGALYAFLSRPAAHPHNAVVQLGVELGFWGVAAGALAGGWVLRAIGRMPEEKRPYAYGTAVFGLVLLMAAYNLWTDSLWAALTLAAFLFGGLARPEIKVFLRAEKENKGGLKNYGQNKAEGLEEEARG